MAGRFDISPELVIGAFHMPNDTRIVGASVVDGCLRLVVIADGVPDSPINQPVELRPFAKRHEAIPEWIEWNWGAPIFNNNQHNEGE